MRVVWLIVLVAVFLAVIPVVSGDQFEDTAVYGYSARNDSAVGFAVRNGHFCYEWVKLSIVSLEDANYSVYVDDVFVLDGVIAVNESFVANVSFRFSSAGWHNFTVYVADDVYHYRVKVLMKSFEQYWEEEVIRPKYKEYSESEVLRIWFTSFVGVSLAAGLAFIVRLDRIKREKRRLL